MTVLMLSELGRRPDQRAQEEFELGSVACRCPECGTADTGAGLVTSLRRCNRCATYWRPNVGMGLAAAAPPPLEVRA